MSRRMDWICVAMAMAAPCADGADWPQFQGPLRNNRSEETHLLSAWPREGPRLVWKVTDLGEGYTTPTIADGMLFGMSYQGDDEVVWCRRTEGGKLVWSTRIAKSNREVDYRQGSRGSPTIDGDRVVALGVSGDLVCLSRMSGDILWRRQLMREFGGILPFYRDSYGYTESPLVDGQQVVVTPGGSQATFAALDRQTGKTLWTVSVEETKKGRNRAAYASLIIAETGGVRQYIQFLQGTVASVSSQGQLLWTWDKPSNNIANCTMPIFYQGQLFVSSGYGQGCGLAKLTGIKDQVDLEEVYFNKRMKNVHGGIVLVDGYVFGNSDPGMLVCLEWSTGDLKWQDRTPGKGSLIYADRHLYYRSEEGPMFLIEASAKGYVQKGEFTPPDRSQHKAWSRPVVVDGRLYLRDQEALHCYDVRK